ncbi:MAG TPA: ABC transporter ATP-binding protein [Termitinemataceae bacterium]|nr:ABC transporter ATP-binding protein [Termitinemataceae bacterium]HPQ00546.1 ABC transporter ATP-binding protein [Termitinemataceae bacterium]
MAEKTRDGASLAPGPFPMGGPRPGRGGPGPGPGPLYLGPKEKPKNLRKTLFFLLRYLGRYKGLLSLIFVLVLVSSVITLLGPYLIGKAVDTMAGGAGQVQMDRLRVLLFLMLGLYLLGGLLTFLQNYWMIRISQNTVRNIRQDLFYHLQNLPLRFFDTRPHGEIMSRLTNDVENINTTLSQSVIQVFSSIITLAGSVGMMLYLSPLLTLLTLLTVPLGFWITSMVSRYTRQVFSTQQKELGNLNALVEESISGERVIKAYGRERPVVLQFETINKKLRRAGILSQIFSGLMGPLMNMINNLSFVIVSAVGGYLALQGYLGLGLIASFIQYSRQFMRPLNEVASQINMIQAAIAGAERILEILEVAPESDGEKLLRPETVQGFVTFDKVIFGYERDRPVLQDVSLEARPGKTIALVGPTGAGKTTIINLLARFYDIDGGTIYVDGIPLSNIERETIRRSLGIVLQDTYLFSASIRENIRYGRLSATDAEVEEAARIAEADPFIRQLPQGYETVLTDDATNISQGQRQLLTIARAILADPAILILDEATSNVDTRTELHIQRALQRLRTGRTSFIIAHRLSTIRDADEIVVINQGRIVERGTHEELLAQRGFYFNLYAAQFRREAELRESENLVV